MTLFRFEEITLTSSKAVAKVQDFFGIERIFKKPAGGVNYSDESSNTTSGLSSSDHDRNDYVHRNDRSSTNGPLRGNNNEQSHIDLKVDYQVSNYFWYFLFQFGAFLGDDAFYYTFVPFWFFNINSFVIRRVLLLWALFMYIGQSSKEVRCLLMGVFCVIVNGNIKIGANNLCYYHELNPNPSRITLIAVTD